MDQENKYTQTSLDGGEINEEEKLRQVKKAEMQKKYRIMSVGLVAVIIVAIVLFVSNRNSNSPEIKQNAETGNTAISQQTPSADLTISQSSLYFSRVGDFADLTANTTGVRWSTNAPNIVSVSDDGRVTALNGGTAEVYAKLNDTIKVCTVTVDTYVPTEDEINEAKRQLQIVEDYEARYTTYSYSEVQAMYDDFINAGNTVTPHSYPGTTIKQLDNAKVLCYYADWYYDLAVYYYDESGTLFYRDEYTLVIDGSFHTGRPPYSRWVTSSVYNKMFSVNTEIRQYHCYHDPNGGAFSWILYGADYVDGIASRTIVTADYLS